MEEGFVNRAQVGRMYWLKTDLVYIVAKPATNGIITLLAPDGNLFETNVPYVANNRIGHEHVDTSEQYFLGYKFTQRVLANRLISGASPSR